MMSQRLLVDPATVSGFGRSKKTSCDTRGAGTVFLTIWRWRAGAVGGQAACRARIVLRAGRSISRGVEMTAGGWLAAATAGGGIATSVAGCAGAPFSATAAVGAVEGESLCAMGAASATGLESATGLDEVDEGSATARSAGTENARHIARVDAIRRMALYPFARLWPRAPEARDPLDLAFEAAKPKGKKQTTARPRMSVLQTSILRHSSSDCTA